MRMLQPPLTMQGYVFAYTMGVFWVLTKGNTSVVSLRWCDRNDRRLILLLPLNTFLFVVGAAVFCEFNGAHLVANLCVSVLDRLPIDELGADYELFYDYLEHRVFHYLALSGAICMHIAIMSVYSHIDIASASCQSIRDRIAVGIAGALLGLMIIAVCIDFPYGCLVGIVMLGAYFVYWLVRMLATKDAPVTCQYFYSNSMWMMSNIAGAVALIGAAFYTGTNGGNNFLTAYSVSTR